MDVKEYRRQVERELLAPRTLPARRAPSSSNPTLVEFGLAPPRSSRGGLPVTRPTLDDLDRDVPALLNRMKTRRLATSTRMAAFRKLAAATFLGERFAPWSAAYLEAMRDLMRDPQTPTELQEGAISTLAGERDPAAQNLLKEGLLHPEKALIPAPTAMALLSLDDHSGAAQVARTLFDRAPDVDTKEAALRALSTDPGAVDLLATVVTDKHELRDLRLMGAAALQCLDPVKFSALAREIIFDDDDFDDIRATSVGAFANRPELHVRSDDDQFREKINALAADTSKTDLSKAAKRLVNIIGDPQPDVSPR